MTHCRSLILCNTTSHCKKSTLSITFWMYHCLTSKSHFVTSAVWQPRAPLDAVKSQSHQPLAWLSLEPSMKITAPSPGASENLLLSILAALLGNRKWALALSNTTLSLGKMVTCCQSNSDNACWSIDNVSLLRTCALQQKRGLRGALICVFTWKICRSCFVLYLFIHTHTHTLLAPCAFTLLLRCYGFGSHISLCTIDVYPSRLLSNIDIVLKRWIILLHTVCAALRLLMEGDSWESNTILFKYSSSNNWRRSGIFVAQPFWSKTSTSYLWNAQTWTKLHCCRVQHMILHITAVEGLQCYNSVHISFTISCWSCWLCL